MAHDTEDVKGMLRRQKQAEALLTPWQVEQLEGEGYAVRVLEVDADTGEGRCLCLRCEECG